jgi:VWFA-related protein
MPEATRQTKLMNKPLLAFLLLLTFSYAAFSQTTTATPPPTNDTDVVKISTTLIQLDIVVTDKKGNQVTNLKPEDFEIYENGEKQNITNFSYISSKPSSRSEDSQTTGQNSKSTDKLPIPVPPSKLKSEKIQRTYAFVVDDLGLSFENVPGVTDSLKKFVNEQMQEGDLVAIVRTGSGMGALQSFTNDKRQLLAAIEKIRWNPQGRGGISAFSPIEPTFKEDLQGIGKVAEGSDEDKEFQEQIDAFRQDNFSIGTLGALNYVIRGMRELPGRKALMLFSEGFPLLVTESGVTRTTRAYELMTLLADLANRSSVVIYTLDPRGLQNPLLANANDVIDEVIPDGYSAGSKMDSDLRDLRARNFRDTQQSLRYLAYETGGLPYVNQNDLSYGMRKVMEDQKGYYLIGYQPDFDTFDPKKNKYNKVSVKLKIKGLNVRYRSGFFGITDEKLVQVKQTKQQQIYSALTSPFGATGVNLNLYAVSGHDVQSGYFIRSLVYIEGKDLKFSQEADGTRKANFDIIAMTFGDNGTSVDQVAKNYTIRVSEKVYQNILDKGFVYNLPIAIKKPGAYQFRIAVRDSASEKIGSVSQFIEVPALRKKLSISKIVLNNFTPEEWRKISTGRPAANQDNQQASLSSTVLRRFKRGTIVHYDAIVYNAKPESIQKSQLQVQVRLFREKNLILESKLSPLNTAGQIDLQRLETSGSITLGKNLQAGDYIMQLVIMEIPAKGKPKISTQFVEFEIVE